MVLLTTKECIKCNKQRRFLADTERDKTSICGECWDFNRKI